MPADSIRSDLTCESVTHSVKSYKGRGPHDQLDEFMPPRVPQTAPDAQRKHRSKSGDTEIISIVSSKRASMRRLKDPEYLVVRRQRRGLFAQLSLIPELNDARDYPEKVKKIIVFIIAFSSILGPMGTSIIFPAIGPITQSFNTTTIMVNVSVGVYSLSIGIFPLWWSSFSEMHGRRTVYIISFAMLFVFCIATAVSPNINAFIILRVLCGAASASVQSVGAGTISDLYIPEERGKNLGIYYLGPLMAPLLSPIISSLLLTRWSWRSTQWFTVILSGVDVLLIVFFLPETLRIQDNKNAIAMMLLSRMKKAEDSVDISEETRTYDAVSEMNADTGLNPDENQSNNYSSNHDNLQEEIHSDTSSTSTNQFDNHSRQIDKDIEGHPDNEDNESEIKKIMTGASSIRDYPAMNHNIDVGAPQMSRIQSHDPKLELQMREHDIARMKTNMEEELNRLETAKTNISKKSGLENRSTKSQCIRHALYIYFLRPMKSVYFLKYPPVSLAITFSAISFAVLYFVNMTIEYDYSRPPYNFKPLYVGLLYIPNSVTYIFASIYGGKWVDALLKNYKVKHGILAPEARISWNVVTALVSFPISLLIFGWCLGKHCHWVTPLIGTALFGYASMMIIGATVSYIVDSLPGRGATGVALNNLIRQTLAAVAIFVTEPMLTGMGTGWAFTMLTFIIMAASGVLIFLKKNGEYWRENYDLKALYDQVE
ncbi:hypothetical protein HG535_0C01930 [Zygotorulaspora mrakii]|uniref:Major facilitator superfamily (MFS) profile domain-containing protein n=1 Tax=Zygotorulaspora mrakii TaxID=42260 RepID=A0A7H9B0G5_ZYGMR|nr:uncharacterized protein HG535_0C01930 [Zygotorulaspora mrakii]QLG71844.1 hypothetical protein HG535_0C01930 [Zygotorulaspora mrakii]